jgi:hypothetical protein
MSSKVNAFETWCYRRMLKIQYSDRVTNVEVLNQMQTEFKFLSSMKKRKMDYAGHVLRLEWSSASIDLGGSCGREEKSGQTK